MVYDVPTSRVSTKIAVCMNCGLVQSYFSKPASHIKKVSISSGADWGNVRYGKAFRTEAHIRLLDKFVDWSTIRNVLDVGSNRGSFIESVYNKGDFNVTAIEPDAKISPNFEDYDRVKLIQDRIENVDLSKETFDLIYMSHTLEHIDSPSESLKQLSRSSYKNTYLLIEVPNLDFIEHTDVIEEFFIDKHTFHFSRNTLKNYLEYYGWEIMYENTTEDKMNITVLSKFKNKNKLTEVKLKDSTVSSETIAMIERYKTTMVNNIGRIKKMAKYIESFYPKKIAVWGAGRLFDSLVTIGGLDLSKIDLVIDKYMPRYVTNVHNKQIIKPDNVDFNNLDTLIVMSREYAAEIKKSANDMGFRGQILDYTSILGMF